MDIKEMAELNAKLHEELAALRQDNERLKKELQILACGSTVEIYMKGFDDAKEIIMKNIKRVQQKSLQALSEQQ